MRLSILTIILSFITSAAANGQSITETVSSNSALSTFSELLQLSGLDETLSGEGPFTVFAPNNEAFRKLPPGDIEKLTAPENKQILISVLTYHVVGGSVKSAQLTDSSVARSVQGSDLNITVGPGVMVNEASVIEADIEASNGIIHITNTLILPPSLQ